jgi:hypothetical protein
MTEKFKEALKSNGQSIKWFYDKYEIRQLTGLTYPGFAGQLNGYSPISKPVADQINKYLSDSNNGR